MALMGTHGSGAGQTLSPELTQKDKDYCTRTWHFLKMWPVGKNDLLAFRRFAKVKKS
jgi:hypothetical protein